MKKTLLLLLSFVFLLCINANPPLPDAGKRWVLNPNYSDEFNGTMLDTAKWHDYHPTWKGRKPGIFVPEMVKVVNGYLKLSGEKMINDTILTYNNSEKKDTFNIKCAAVVSKKLDAHYGYYECRAKAAQNTMSLTFWFSSRRSHEGPKGCNDNFSQEWDIHESIGKEGDFEGTWFAKGMHSNAHFWYNDCDGNRHDYRAKEVRFENEKLSSEEFNIYGGWWHDSISATYYYNNGEPQRQDFYTEISDAPMVHPMGMNLVHETYPFPWISLPEDSDLADTSKNYVFYDWVRAYIQVDDSANTPYNNYPKLNLYEENVAFINERMEVESAQIITIPLLFQCNEDRYVSVKIIDKNGNIVAKNTIKAYEGYAHYLMYLKSNEAFGKGAYTVLAELKKKSAGKTFINKANAQLIIK